MAKFAAQTEVPIEKSKAEIERTVMRYGATSFSSGWKDKQAAIGFEIKSRRVRFILPLPDQADRAFTHWSKRGSAYEQERSPEAAMRLWEQACRQRFRALALAVKAKLEAVDAGISTFEDEFLAHIVLADGTTLGDRIIPQLEHVINTGAIGLLPAPPESNP